MDKFLGLSTMTAIPQTNPKLNVDPNFSSPLQSKAFLTFAFIALRVLLTQSDPYQAHHSHFSEKANQILQPKSKYLFLLCIINSPTGTS